MFSTGLAEGCFCWENYIFNLIREEENTGVFSGLYFGGAGFSDQYFRRCVGRI